MAPAGATLVRADLFAALGGFDAVVDRDGEDLDLSWRARLLGARVMVVPVPGGLGVQDLGSSRILG